MKNIFHYETIIGRIAIAEEDGAITHLVFVNREHEPTGYVAAETALLRKAKQQLDEYFAGKRKTFDLPLAPKGTPFQQRDWKVLQKIPYGETWSYKDVAIEVGSPRGFRAVGLANNRNPIAIIIPCHRVIGANGKLVGYGGGLDIKMKLLDLEGAAYCE